MIHVRGAIFFLLLKLQKKQQHALHKVSSPSTPLPLLPGKKTPWGPKGNSGSSAWKWRHLEIRYDPGFCERIRAIGWMKIFLDEKQKKHQLTNWSFPTNLINILKLHWIGKHFDMECTNKGWWEIYHPNWVLHVGCQDAISWCSASGHGFSMSKASISLLNWSSFKTSDIS